MIPHHLTENSKTEEKNFLFGFPSSDFLQQLCYGRGGRGGGMAVSGGGDKSNDSNLDAGKKVPYYSLLSFFFSFVLFFPHFNF